MGKAPLALHQLHDPHVLVLTCNQLPTLKRPIDGDYQTRGLSKGALETPHGLSGNTEGGLGRSSMASATRDLVSTLEVEQGTYSVTQVVSRTTQRMF